MLMKKRCITFVIPLQRLRKLSQTGNWENRNSQKRNPELSTVHAENPTKRVRVALAHDR